tara:strand:- start:375 stop:518 length:144 start_codon:yes stop_codon:yes gene_type:complete
LLLELLKISVSQGDYGFLVAVARFELATLDNDSPALSRVMQKSRVFQ